MPYIKGQEASGAIVIGARYGDGTLVRKAGGTTKVHWTGPTIGFDAGGNLSKVFVLIYNLPNTEAIFQRFPAIDGSFYFIGGVGANYHQMDNIVLAPYAFWRWFSCWCEHRLYALSEGKILESILRIHISGNSKES